VTSLRLDVKGRRPRFSQGVVAVNLPTLGARRCRRRRIIRNRNARTEVTLGINGVTEVKTLLLAGATVALLTTVSFSPAIAQEPKLSGGDTEAGISQDVHTRNVNPHMAAAHYEYRYGYVRGGDWRGRWILVR
jgi:hypothetical protein